MRREALESAIEAIERGEAPVLALEDVPAFSKGRPHIDAAALEELLASLTEDDLPTLRRALRAIDEGDIAWLGFKLVFDEDAAVTNVDNEVTRKYGEQGSADGRPLVFFCNDAKEVVCSRAYSPRDLFQMKDVTRGPSMHTEQFDGLTWASAPLFDAVRVWLLGASDVASYVARYAGQVGFDVTVVDYDPAFVSAQRFPDARRIVLDGEGFSQIEVLKADAADYVCVLTRGHMHDPESCVWALRHGVHYVGMMGCKGKNEAVFDLVTANGVTEEQWESVKRPIGLSFGAKTPAELAIAIVAELIDVRYRQRYSEEARAKHERSLGRL
ncbi:XdhC family protein [Gordonibacter sp. Marseille-P4307]|uniref:XdhC family protein n=1 Tax=Gordonibacter sp. Marseille-P4307 TaxID=2161815 RepID=UPI000F524744|nr:XdhC family protein [Gordonibacter sp. Marseille-P4307]